MAGIGSRLCEERKRLGLSQQNLADSVGVDRRAIGRYEKGENVPGGAILASFAKLGANVHYILTGERETAIHPHEVGEPVAAYETEGGKHTFDYSIPEKQTQAFNKLVERLQANVMLIDHFCEAVPQANDHPEVVVEKEYQDNFASLVESLHQFEPNKVVAQTLERSEKEFALIPVLDVEASAGHGSLVEQEDVRYSLAFKKDWIRQEFGISPKQLRIITAKGDSMDSGQGREKDIHDGDLLLVNTGVNRIDSDAIYIIQLDGHVLVKRIQQMLDGSVKIISANPDYEPQLIDGELVNEMRIAGRVAWVMSGHKP